MTFHPTPTFCLAAHPARLQLRGAGSLPPLAWGCPFWGPGCPAWGVLAVPPLSRSASAPVPDPIPQVSLKVSIHSSVFLAITFSPSLSLFLSPTVSPCPAPHSTRGCDAHSSGFQHAALHSRPGAGRGLFWEPRPPGPVPAVLGGDIRSQRVGGADEAHVALARQGCRERGAGLGTALAPDVSRAGAGAGGSLPLPGQSLPSLSFLIAQVGTTMPDSSKTLTATLAPPKDEALLLRCTWGH